MFNKQKNVLNKYRKKRNESISFFRISVEFDWIVLVIFAIIISAGVFVWSFDIFENIKNFYPENPEGELFLSEDELINKNIDNLLSKGQ